MAEMKRKNVETRDLPVTLDDKEILDYARDLANRLGSIHHLEEEVAKLRREFRELIASHQDEVNRLSKAIKTGEEQRPIACEVMLDFEQKKRVVVRGDTQEIIETGPIPEMDHQLEFGNREGVEDNPPDVTLDELKNAPQFEVAAIPDDAKCMTCENKSVAGRALSRDSEVAGLICQACADDAGMEYDGMLKAFCLPAKEDDHGKR